MIEQTGRGRSLPPGEGRGEGSSPAPALPDLVAALRSGELDLLAHLDDLERLLASREPEIHAFVPEPGRFERLRREARALLKRFPDPATRPPLFGAPVGVKDIFHVEGFETRAGSRLPPKELAGREGEAVARLKAAGALVLGKTVTTEFATFAPGPTRNPRNPGHTPGGSSSGSAAAVAAAFCPLALGTQTIGSVGRPASYCGVVGFKPSFGSIATSGLVPLAPSLDHVGFFTATVEGAELAAAVLCNPWRPAAADPHRPVLGIPEGPYLDRASDEGLAHFRSLARKLGAAGFAVKTVAALGNFEDLEEAHFTVFDAEAARTHAAWYARYGRLYHAKTREILERGEDVEEAELAAALAGREQLRDKLTGLMDRHELDLWISPSATGPAPHGLDFTGSPVMNLPWTYAGLPTLTVPGGCNGHGLPLGVQLTGRFGADEAMLAWARAVEAALG